MTRWPIGVLHYVDDCEPSATCNQVILQFRAIGNGFQLRYTSPSGTGCAGSVNISVSARYPEHENRLPCWVKIWLDFFGLKSDSCMQLKLSVQLKPSLYVIETGVLFRIRYFKLYGIETSIVCSEIWKSSALKYSNLRFRMLAAEGPYGWANFQKVNIDSVCLIMRWALCEYNSTYLRCPLLNSFSCTLSVSCWYLRVLSITCWPGIVQE